MTPTRVLVFILVVTLLLGGGHVYVYRRLVHAADLGPKWELRLKVALALLAVAVPLGFFLQRSGQAYLRPLFFVSFGWMGLMSFLVLLTLAADLVAIGAWVIEKLRSAPPDESRRTTLRRVLSLGVAGVTGAVGMGGAVAAFRPVVKRVRVPVAGLPEALVGFRIVQITDVHVGPLIQVGFVEGLVREINALRPDMVAITGDLVDGSVDRLREHVAPLGTIASRFGTFFVTGNHEYFSGVDGWRSHLRSLGVRVLENERVRLPGGLDVAGVEDFRGGRWNLDQALSGREPGVPCVLLAHQPKHAPLAAAHDVSLILSGHTHGGQFVPWSLVVALDQRFVAGLYTLGKTLLYVSRGTGFWGPPLRVMAEPEITELVLERA